MNIIEAIYKSGGKAIKRKNDDSHITPTNTAICCLVSYTNFNGAEKQVPRWNPTRDDLIADDWEIVNESR